MPSCLARPMTRPLFKTIWFPHSENLAFLHSTLPKHVPKKNGFIHDTQREWKRKRTTKHVPGQLTANKTKSKQRKGQNINMHSYNPTTGHHLDISDSNSERLFNIPKEGLCCVCKKCVTGYYAFIIHHWVCKLVPMWQVQVLGTLKVLLQSKGV